LTFQALGPQRDHAGFAGKILGFGQIQNPTKQRYMSMRHSIVLLAVAAAALFLFVTSSAPVAYAQDGATIVVPESSIERPGDIGLRAHTNIILNIHPDNTSPCGPRCETPASLACVYKVVTQVAGCPIATTSVNPSGGVGSIALVDAFDNPDAVTDINTYANQFGIPVPTFQVVFASGTRPPNNPGGWSLEEALDIEMAVATAPKAKIFLVEAADNSFTNLYLAEQVASNLVAQNGGGFVSNSWSGGEYQGELNDEKTYFTTPKVIYFASTGDAGLNNIGVPAVFASVVAAGGTRINRDSSGKFTSESWWTGGGGGLSTLEPRPAYQNVIQSIVGTHRGVPDMSAVADPNTGPAVFDLDGGFGWFQVGGTSVSSPYLAGTISGAGRTGISTKAGLTLLYQEYANPTQYKADWTDITAGGSSCKVGWDVCTGVGSPLTYKGK
jgi:kumamolisin